jgi:hypothetical protein
MPYIPYMRKDQNYVGAAGLETEEPRRTKRLFSKRTALVL